MLYENWWHVSSEVPNIHCPPLTKHITTDCLVIGAGFAGLHAALRLVDAGKKVVLLEKSVCGGSSSGQSGGFITPESEENADKLIRKYGDKKAMDIYNLPLTGLNLIVDTIKKYGLNCDFKKQDSLYLAAKESHNSTLEEEAETRKTLGLPYTLLTKKQLQKVHPGKHYTSGLLYPGSYGINSYAYAQEMKRILLKKGVAIYESTEVEKLDGNTAKARLGSVRAGNIVICIDKMKSEFNTDVSRHYYHLQSHIGVSEPLSAAQVATLFPQGQHMCWDTRWDYTYYRLIADNRLVVGGSSFKTGYTPYIVHTPRVMNRLIDELKEQFPVLNKTKFTHYWSGLIDVTKDLTPIADYDHNNKSIQYAMGCAGLPWAAFCGDYLARRIVDSKKTKDFSDVLGFHRKHFLPMGFQSIFGKRITFGLSHLKQLLS